MSTSSAEPTLSVVVASNGAPGAVGRCLTALAEHGDGVEVIVCEPAPSPAELRRRFPFATWHVREGALVPELWSDGVGRATGELVALTISPMVPEPGWLASLRAALVGSDAVGGAIEPAAGLRLVDLAEYFCRYSRDMLPFTEELSLELAGDNAGYRRHRLQEVDDTWREGFWEPDVHRALAARGARLRHDPSVVVRMSRSAGASAFLRQRLTHGREFGRSRGRGSGRPVNLARVLLAAVVPLVLMARTSREVFRRRRLRMRLIACIPLLVAFDVAWATGEALGHLDALRGR
jgi:hypothetical protein